MLLLRIMNSVRQLIILSVSWTLDSPDRKIEILAILEVSDGEGTHRDSGNGISLETMTVAFYTSVQAQSCEQWQIVSLSTTTQTCLKLRVMLALPVVLVVAGAGEGDHHGTVEGQHHGAESPAPATPALSEALQLPSQVERGETQTRESNWGREIQSEKLYHSYDYMINYHAVFIEMSSSVLLLN